MAQSETLRTRPRRRDVVDITLVFTLSLAAPGLSGCTNEDASRGDSVAMDSTQGLVPADGDWNHAGEFKHYRCDEFAPLTRYVFRDEERWQTAQRALLKRFAENPSFFRHENVCHRGGSLRRRSTPDEVR